MASLNSSTAEESPSSIACVMQCVICSLMIAFPRPLSAELTAEICTSTSEQSSSFSIIFLICSRCPIIREIRLIWRFFPADHDDAYDESSFFLFQFPFSISFSTSSMESPVSKAIFRRSSYSHLLCSTPYPYELFFGWYRAVSQ